MPDPVEECTHVFGVKSVLVPLGLVAVDSVLEAGFYKKVLGSGRTTLYQTKKWETYEIRSLEDSVLLIKGTTKVIETKE